MRRIILVITAVASITFATVATADAAVPVPAADTHKAGITQSWFYWGDGVKSVEFTAKPGHAKRIKVWFNDFDKWGAYGDGGDSDGHDGWTYRGTYRVDSGGVTITSWYVDVKRNAPTYTFRWKVVR